MQIIATTHFKGNFGIGLELVQCTVVIIVTMRSIQMLVLATDSSVLLEVSDHIMERIAQPFFCIARSGLFVIVSRDLMLDGGNVRES